MLAPVLSSRPGSLKQARPARAVTEFELFLQIRRCRHLGPGPTPGFSGPTQTRPEVHQQ